MKNICYTSIFQDCSDFRCAATVYPAGLEYNSRIFTRINTRKTARGAGESGNTPEGAKKACFSRSKKSMLFLWRKNFKNRLISMLFQGRRSTKTTKRANN